MPSCLMAVIHCPECRKQIAVYADPRMDNSDARYWTDGNYVTPNYRFTPLVAKCPYCSSCFWPKEETWFKVEESCGESDSASSIRKNAPRLFENPSELDYYKMLYNKIRPDKEEIIRFRLWWMANDRYRDPDCRDAVSFSAEEESNIRILDKWFDEDWPGDLILKVEIRRELGEFFDALDLCKKLRKNLSFMKIWNANQYHDMLAHQVWLILNRSRKVNRYS